VVSSLFCILLLWYHRYFLFACVHFGNESYGYYMVYFDPFFLLVAIVDIKKGMDVWYFVEIFL
jgi:hypothetical protein